MGTSTLTRKRRTVAVREDTLTRLKAGSRNYSSIDAFLQALLDREERRTDCEAAKAAMASATAAELAGYRSESAFFDQLQDETPVE